MAGAYLDNGLKGRDFLTISDFTTDEIRLIIDAWVVGQAALDGDPEAQAILDRAGRNLGVAIANVVNLLNPEVFIIGGGVIYGVGDLILNPVRDEAYKNTYPPYRKYLKIIPAGLMSQSGILGAAALAWDHLSV
jgi:glucokinase